MATLGLDATQLTPSEHQRQLRRAVIASTIGTAIEWYDFFLYSTVTGLVFAKLSSCIPTPGSARWRHLPFMLSASSRGRSVLRSSGIMATGSAAKRR